MFKKIIVAVGIFAISALTAGTMAFAQTTVTPTESTTSPTVSPMPTSEVVPSGAPSTGMGL